MNDVISNTDLSKETYKINGKIEPEKSFSNGGSIVYPLEIIKPMISSDATKLNVAFQAEVNSKKDPHHAGIPMSVQLANQEEWLSGELSNERKELSTEEHLLKSLKRVAKHRGTKVVNGHHLYISDIANTSKEQFADVNISLESRNVGKKHDAENPIEKRRKNYIRFYRRSTDKSNLMQKLRGKDCVKLPNEFYFEHDTRDVNSKEDTIKNGLNIEPKINDEENKESDEYKQRSGAAAKASISDGSINYKDLNSKSIDNLRTDLTLIGKKHVINNKINNRLHGKLTRRH